MSELRERAKAELGENPLAGDVLDLLDERNELRAQLKELYFFIDYDPDTDGETLGRVLRDTEELLKR